MYSLRVYVTKNIIASTKSATLVVSKTRLTKKMLFEFQKWIARDAFNIYYITFNPPGAI